jgi:hypothetical protein
MFYCVFSTYNSLLKLKIIEKAANTTPLEQILTNQNIVETDWISFDLLCLTPPSAIFQLCHGDQF